MRLRDIALYELAPGDRLPSERQLSQSYGVSAITVRQAVASLVAEGIVYTEQGRGIFVAARPVELDRTQGSSSAGLASSEVISNELVEADERLRRALAIQSNVSVRKIRQVLSTEPRMPVALETFYVAARQAPGLAAAAPGLELDVGAFLMAECGSPESAAACTIRAVTADRWRAGLLQIAPGSALLLQERTVATPGVGTAFFSRSFFRSDRVRLAFELSRGTQPLVHLTHHLEV